MTQTGKCDTCRQRKVKVCSHRSRRGCFGRCDEEKPKCGACRKKNRPCSYSYGKASAFIVQDPQQLTKHGRSKVKPVMYSLADPEKPESILASAASDLHVTTSREVENGQGFFQTLAPLSKRRAAASRRHTAQQRKKLELYLQQLQAEAAISSIKPSCPETTLIARYIDMLGTGNKGHQPLSILGTWIDSIPSRIGSNRMMDFAVEFFVNSHAVYWDDTHSKRNLASASKEKALKELQLFVLNANNTPTYEVLLATKMHYAAEALLGIEYMYYAIHAFGLAELLKHGVVENVDDEHFWNLIDNTYIDDVNEAMLAGRNSVYDNDFYLSSTYPPSLSINTSVLSASQRASMATMHVAIQCPRLVNLVRYAISHQDDTTALVAAITLAESLWQVNLAEQIAPLLNESLTVSSRHVPGLADVFPDSYDFTSVQNLVLCTRYWMLMNVLGGFVDTLYRYFPVETALSRLPDRYEMHKIDIEAAENLLKSMPWADTLSKKLPLVPLRLHTPLQISIGAWYRTIQRLNTVRIATPDLDPDVEIEIERTTAYAYRMKSYIIEECNKIHRQWDVSIVSEKPLFETLSTMAGEQIPDWLPVRVRFEAEGGEMVMRLDYENEAGSFYDSYILTEDPPRKISERAASHCQEAGVAVGNHEMQEYILPIRGEKNMEPRNVANFVHETGRNLCSTSGWWPSEEPSDGTHTAHAYSKLPLFTRSSPQSPIDHVDRHPCLASSFWPQRPNWATGTDGIPKNSCLSPAWASPVFLMTRASEDNTDSGNPTPYSGSAVHITPMSYETWSTSE